MRHAVFTVFPLRHWAICLLVASTGTPGCWLQVGTVWVNCWMVRDLHVPFGGKKSSGTGREGVNESIEFFTDVKTTCCQLAAP